MLYYGKSESSTGRGLLLKIVPQEMKGGGVLPPKNIYTQYSLSLSLRYALMTDIVKIQESNSNGTHSITIPKELREKLGWKAGEHVKATIEKGQLIYKKVA